MFQSHKLLLRACVVVATTGLGACAGGGSEASTSSLSNAGAVNSTEATNAQNTQGSLRVENCELTAIEEELLLLTNARRAEPRWCGDDYYEAAAPVTWNCQLTQAALKHSTDMGENNFFSHTGSDGSRIGARVTATDYEWQMVGENIAAGFYSAPDAMQGWVDSPSHCSALMNPAYHETSTAVFIEENSDYQVYWTMVLAKPRS